MRVLAILLIFLSVSSLSYGQAKDTIFLKENHVIVGGRVFNEYKSGLKDGPWIEYKFKSRVMEKGGHWRGEKSWGYYSVDTVYRPLIKNEYRGIENVLVNDSTLRSDGWKSYDYRSEIILDYIPPKLYYIESRGTYEKGRKVGVWNYFDQDGKLLKSENIK